MEAASDARTVATAVAQYIYDHGEWVDLIDSTGPDVVNRMMGSNRLEIWYMDFRESQRTNGFPDCWGRFYHISVVSNTVCVWSDGGNRVNDNGEEDDVLYETELNPKVLRDSVVRDK